jgi:hypothetical protein
MKLPTTKLPGSQGLHFYEQGVSRQVDSEQPNFADWPLSSKVEENEQIQ